MIENTHQGKAFAVFTGIRQAKSDYVIFTDIDLATPIEEVERLIEKTKNGGQIVIGSRSTNREGAPLMRKVMAKGLIVIRNIIIGLKGVKDTQCGFKLFERKPALKIMEKLQVFHNKRIAKGSSVTAGFDIEFLFLGQKLGYKIIEVPVIWKHVETKNVNFIRDSLEAFVDLLKIRLLDLQGKYR